MKRFVILIRFVILTATLSALTIGPSLFADNGANHQVRNQHFGVSGGNVNDISRAFCCSGTLGALVFGGNTSYILSNNHVLGRSGQAVTGEDISQPGLIDNSCRPATIVADFTVAAPLGTSNVDAALAELRPNQMDGTGYIEDIGVPSSTVAAPSIGMSVAKSGRTTGFTTGSVSSVNTSVSVQYQKNCGSGKKFVISYTNQVVIGSSTFSAGGDSGSLIVTNDSSHQPVALLYAGSSTTTIGNPIGEVLSKLGAALGSSLSFGGHGHHGGNVASASEGQSAGPSREKIDFATTVMRQRESDLLSRPGVIGVGVGASETDPNDVSIVVYIDVNSLLLPSVPRRINSVRLRRVFTEPFVAY